MVDAWVVDSNCFIHMGQKAQPSLLNDLRSALGPNGVIHVTPGVHREVATVRLSRQKNAPRLLDVLEPLLRTTTVDEGQVRGLAQMIGETAAPQDVDLSLMVLANQFNREGLSVMLVSDDYKMTTTAEKANLGYSTCPPSTFLQHMADRASGKGAGNLRSLSRRVRAAEMSYAISRAKEYNIQEKLTWMVDSLLSGRAPAAPVEDSPNLDDEARLVRGLVRHLRGERVKSSVLTALGPLPEVCAPAGRLDDHLEALRLGRGADALAEAITETTAVMTEVLEAVGLGLSPLSEDLAELAHRAMAGSLQRAHTALGIMHRMQGGYDFARMHLGLALHQATLVADTGAELRVKQRLGMLALARGDAERAASLLEAAERQANEVEADRRPMLVLAAIARHMMGDGEAAAVHVDTARRLLEADRAGAVATLHDAGRALLAIDRADLALELIDEAMECAVTVGDDSAMAEMLETMMLVESALASSEREEDEALTALLDGLHDVGDAEAATVEAARDEVGEQLEAQAAPLEATASAWSEAADLIPESAPLVVLRLVEDEEGRAMIVAHHADLGTLGLWLPDGALAIGPGDHLGLRGTRVKIADAPPAMREAHGLRGVVALESPSELRLLERSESLDEPETP